MDEAMNVAGRRHDELSAREKPGTSFKLGTFSRVRLYASVSAAREVNKMD